MYINKIDELIDNIIDDFYNYLITNDQFKKIISVDKITNIQGDINKLLKTYQTAISKNASITEIASNEESIYLINDTIGRYIGFYFFVFISNLKEYTKNQFINDMLEFTKLQSNFAFKVSQLFTSDGTANVIKISNTVKNILNILNGTNKLENYEKNEDYRDGYQFLMSLNEDIIGSLKKENFDANGYDQIHSIIKLIIFIKYYLDLDKKEIYNVIEDSQKSGEYIFIDIVMPKKEFIDFGIIEKILTPKQNEDGLANKLYDLITESENKSILKLEVDEKILKLIDNNILIPITEDFLLYNKDTEKYEKVHYNQQKKKNKDDTKLKYIINKIDSIADINTSTIRDIPEVKDNVEKLFYMPLYNRRAVLINHIEDIQIFNKFRNQGTSISLENNDLLNELKIVMTYPYVNYTTMGKPGFNLVTNKTVDTVRDINFLEDNLNKIVEMRVSSILPVNIVGFIINNNAVLECLKNNEIVDIRNLDKNGFKQTINLLKNKILNDIKDKYTYYWHFDTEKDIYTFDKYEQVGRISKQDIIKYMIGEIYDSVIENIYLRINNIIDKNNISYYTLDKLVDYYKKFYFDISYEENLLLGAVEKILFNNKKKIDISYDLSEDKYYGLDDNIIKLPSFKRNDDNINKIIKINLQKVQEDKIKESSKEIIKYNAICQHNISWDKISKLGSSSFSEKLVEFIYKYAIENDDKDFICKSCGVQINIKKFVLDGGYDESGGFKIFSTPIKTSLDNMQEYDNYKQTMRNIDKLIDRLANIGNIHILQEKSLKNKNQLKVKLIKDCLDLLLEHNKIMYEYSKNTKIYNERQIRVKNTYGLSNSSFFVFVLDDEIFRISSKDKDKEKYKIIKRNNILIYILFFAILEITDAQITYMTGDKKFDFDFFQKIGPKLFESLSIITNDNKILNNIFNYQVLSYLVLYFSYMITKYNLWKSSDEQTTQKGNINTIKEIIHTLLDLINSILETYIDSKKKNIKLHYLYEMISSRFFVKLNTVFKDENIINKLSKLHQTKVNSLQKNIKSGKKQVSIIKLQEKIDEYKDLNDLMERAEKRKKEMYIGVNKWNKVYPYRFEIFKKKPVDNTIYKLSEMTNCPSGEFHVWDGKGICLKCKQNINDYKINDYKSKDDNKFEIKYDEVRLIEKSKIYCVNGQKHKFVYNDKDKNNYCSLCNYEYGTIIDNNKLKELKNNLLKNKLKNKENTLLNKDYDINDNKINKIIKDIKNEMNKNANYIENFINKLESLTSKNLNLKGKNIYITTDTYIIDHNYQGYSLDNPLIIRDDENKILIKKDHSFFKKDVYYYVDKNLQIEVFYDKITLLLIGYREKNKNFELIKNTSAYMKINYSIKNKIKYLGYKLLNFKIIDNINNLKKELEYVKNNEEKENIIKKEIIKDISRNRIINLKKAITDIQKFIFRAKYSYDPTKLNNEFFDYSFIESYINKLIKLKLKKNNNIFFENWEGIKYGVFYETTNKNINIDINTNYLNVNDMSDYDVSGNLILYYIIRELDKLININDDDSFIQNQICFFIMEIIDNIYSNFNKEDENQTYDLKKFKLILNSYLFEAEELDNEIVEEITDEVKEQIYSDEEEAQALDLDQELDYEIDYASGINFN